jgi:C4-dicarboxylate-specific signal transduction histidine kinase
MKTGGTAIVVRTSAETRPLGNDPAKQRRTKRRVGDYVVEFRTITEVKRFHVSAEEAAIQRRGQPLPVGATFGQLGHQGVAFVLDLTEHKRAEHRGKLRQLEADLAHINRFSALGELASSIAHELKQPITATMANASAGIL